MRTRGTVAGGRIRVRCRLVSSDPFTERAPAWLVAGSSDGCPAPRSSYRAAFLAVLAAQQVQVLNNASTVQAVKALKKTRVYILDTTTPTGTYGV